MSFNSLILTGQHPEAATPGGDDRDTGGPEQHQEPLGGKGHSDTVTGGREYLTNIPEETG